MTRASSNDNRHSDIVRLADDYGIEPAFRDARGQNVEVGDTTSRLLLEAMGVRTVNHRDVSAVLEPSERAAIDALPPVVVTRLDGDCCCIEVASPPGCRQIAWMATLEDGTERTGTGDVTGTVAEADQALGTGRSRLNLRGLPLGYHRLFLPALQADTVLIVVPGNCWLPADFNEGTGRWGISVQLYLLRSAGNWGIGDFADLKVLVRLCAARGCDVIGLNPLHQMFLDDPEHASPYSPASRLYLNALYISVPAVREFGESDEAQELLASDRFAAELKRVRSVAFVDYAAVAELKVEALRLAFSHFRSSAREARTQAFRAFRLERGEMLERTSVFLLLRRHLAGEGASPAHWRDWPEPYRDCRSDAVRRFADECGDELEFLVWLQWVADEQLEDAARAADEAGMTFRLYRDLAVGCDTAGAETWANPGAFLRGAQVGAPPDIFNPAGQNWGLPPFHPHALKQEAYESFVELVRSNMRHAGGLRIDHVMGLQHLYCIPDGATPDAGAYVRYPIDDMVGILALESQRHRCLVVGEDLGTVPEGFRERMAAANILSYRVLFFEQDWSRGTFLAPDRYPRLALAVTGSHDLPTLRGWWQERDIALKEELGLYPDPDEASSQRERRDADRRALLRALRAESLIPDGDVSVEEFAHAAHGFLSRTGSALVVPQLDDLFDEAEPVNVPGTFLEYPNWRRKYNRVIESLEHGDEAWERLGEILKSRRE